MKRVIIICEGETEREFCTKILAPYYINKRIIIQSPLIKKSRGGIVKWDDLKREILCYLKNEPSAFVTTFIDYYGLQSNLKFPNWDESLKIQDKYDRLKFIEEGMIESISAENINKFIPYLQLHEFEALLFINKDIFYQQIPKVDLIGETELEEVFSQFRNPELINSTFENYPSKRITRIIYGYHKVLHGHYISEAIGLDRIIEKCPKFRNWINTIESIT